MRAIYAAVLTFFIAAIFLLVGSFFYMDKERRRAYNYEIEKDGCPTAAVRVDKFRTEDRTIYKSSADMVSGRNTFEEKKKISVDGNGVFESYSEEKLMPKEVGSVCIENKGGCVSFVSRSGPDFAYIENLPASKNPLIFRENSPITYFPILERYDFDKGGPQAFQALTILRSGLPPIKRVVTLTSVNDEYVKCAGRKIKTERMILKIRNYPQGSVWVAKSDRAMIKAELPGEGLRITRTFSPSKIKAAPDRFTADVYRAENITFKSKGVEIAGTITVPEKEGSFPAVILVGGDGPQDRSYYGFFDSIADHLSRNGICVLRFDKRGVGSSTGSYISYCTSDETEDINAAAEHLASLKYVNPEKISAAGHAEGADRVLRAVSDASKVKSIILLSPDIFMGEEKRLEKTKRSVPAAGANSHYLSLVEQCFRESVSKALSVKGKWIYLLGKRCFLGEVKWRLDAKPIEDLIRQIKLPVLIIQGRKDEASYPECASIIDSALQSGGNNARVLVYYGNLGRFFGKKLTDCGRGVWSDPDKEMMDGIAAWINAKPATETEKIDLT